MKKFLFFAFALALITYSCQKDALSASDFQVTGSTAGVDERGGGHGHHHGDSLHIDTLGGHHCDSLHHDSLHVHHDSLHVHNDSLHVPHDSLHIHNDSTGNGGHHGGGHHGGGHGGGHHGHGG